MLHVTFPEIRFSCLILFRRKHDFFFMWKKGTPHTLLAQFSSLQLFLSCWLSWVNKSNVVTIRKRKRNRIQDKLKKTLEEVKKTCTFYRSLARASSFAKNYQKKQNKVNVKARSNDYFSLFVPKLKVDNLQNLFKEICQKIDGWSQKFAEMNQV